MLWKHIWKVGLYYQLWWYIDVASGWALCKKLVHESSTRYFKKTRLIVLSLMSTIVIQKTHTYKVYSEMKIWLLNTARGLRKFTMYWRALLLLYSRRCVVALPGGTIHASGFCFGKRCQFPSKSRIKRSLTRKLRKVNQTFDTLIMVSDNRKRC